MTSPSLIAEPVTVAPAPERTKPRLALPILLFCVTMLSTTSVGMRYMYNFNLGRPPLSSDADILPFDWVFAHFSGIAAGLPFSLTLIAILLAHEFGHYFACRAFKVNASLPYLLPAPSLSGSFGAVIRLKSRVRSRAALIVIGAMGPLCGFLVALFTITLGLKLSHYADAPTPLVHKVQAPLLFHLLHALLPGVQDASHTLAYLIPHPILTASWMGILITALNLIPAGQLDGGHILYALSPTAHKYCHRFMIVGLFALGIFYWAGWILWGAILMTPGMRHPLVPDDGDIKRWHYALIPVCLLIFILSSTYQPFQGFGLLEHAARLLHRR